MALRVSLWILCCLGAFAAGGGGGGGWGVGGAEGGADPHSL